MMRFRKRVLLTVTFFAACGDGGTEPPAPEPPRATTVTVTPPTAELAALGATVQLSARVLDQNGNAMAGTAVTWSSGSPAVATVSAAGLVTAAGNGTATATATSGSASGTASVTVDQVVHAVMVSPAADTLVAFGDTLRLVAEPTDANGHAVADVTEFVWASSDTLVAKVDDTGLVETIAEGEAVVTATTSGVTGRADLTVVPPLPTTMAVSPDTVWFTAVGQTKQLAVEVREQSGRVMGEAIVSWASSDTTVAAVDSAGLLTAMGGGTTTVTASAGDVSGDVVVSVMQSAGSVVVTPAEGTIAPGGTLRLAAEAFDDNGHAVEDAEFVWSSSDGAVVRVDASGLATGVAEGRVTVTAASGDARGTSEITVENPDRAALAALYEATDGPNWHNSDNWLTDAPLNDWYGVGVDDSGRVTEVRLHSNNLVGPIPPALARLTALRDLNLEGNLLTGSIPSELGELSDLRYLRLANNRLEGPIPGALARLLHLEVLRLGNNQLTGTIPAELGGLHRLRDLWLGGNQLTGTIPAELANLANLKSLGLGWSALEGSIPAELGRLSNLKSLWLSYNKLSGPIPPELGNLANVEELWLDNNALTGPLPQSFLQLQRLETIAFGDNESVCAPGTPVFVAWLEQAENARGSYCNESDRTVLESLYDATAGTGWIESAGWSSKSTIGEWHGVTADSLGRVTTLDLTSNGLSGTLPRSLGELTQMSVLRLGGNALAGRLPLPLAKLTLAEFRYAATDLCIPPEETFQRWLGSIPIHEGTGAQCAPLSDREILEVFYDATGGTNWFRSDNWLSNTPLREWYGVEVDGQGRVVELRLRDNGLRGSIPQELGSFADLRTLDLHHNELSGPIPPELGNLTNLRYLNLHGSWERDAQRLTGPIPPELGDLGNLRKLDLNLNHLTGPIPPELGNLAGLARLNLRANRLTGAIPPQLANLTDLRELYLGVNHLAGSIPPELGNLADLRYLSLKLNDLGGPIPSELGNLAALVKLDLGANHLTGPIPPELGKLVESESLRLEDNDLRGSVPSELSRMANLRSLHLGANAGLTGPLPTDLTALGQLGELVAGQTALCAPPDTHFQAWLEGIPIRRVATCGNANRASAYLIQAAQSLEFPVPLVAGEKALLRVFPTARSATAAGIPAVRARFYRDGRETYVEDIPGKGTPIPVDLDEGSLDKSANAEIPGHVIMPGLEMVIEVDPDGTLDPALGVATRIPETGRLAVEVREMPTFRLTVVPFIWQIDPDSTILAITRAMADDPGGHPLLEKTRTILPVSDIEVTAHEPVLTSYNRVGPLSREARAIWAIEGGSGHLLGLMTGQFMGIGANATQDGRVVVSRIDERHGDATLAHEFGHNMSLRHPPKKYRDPSAVHVTDFAYPHADGSIGVWGYDSRFGGRLLPPTTIDIMAGVDWISDYHFTNAVRYRLADEGAASTEATPLPATKSLLLWGDVDGMGRPDLKPAFVVDAPAAQPVSPGPWRITGRSAIGAEVFSFSFDMPAMAHGDGASSFVFLLPVQPGWPETLASITLSGPTGSVSLDGESDHPMAILRNPRTGQVRGILRDLPAMALAKDDAAAALALTSAGAAAALSLEPGLEVLFSRGIPDKTAWQR